MVFGSRGSAVSWMAGLGWVVGLLTPRESALVSPLAAVLCLALRFGAFVVDSCGLASDSLVEQAPFLLCAVAHFNSVEFVAVAKSARK